MSSYRKFTFAISSPDEFLVFSCVPWLSCYTQMENIQLFLNFCESYGVPKTGLFQTVDLFEGRNLPQVLNCIQQLGTEASLSYLITPNSKEICKIAYH